jgi:hypothetical protein
MGQVLVEYVGDSVIEVHGVGVFSRGTTAMVPEGKAMEMVKNGEFTSPALRPEPVTAGAFSADDEVEVMEKKRKSKRPLRRSQWGDG